MFRMEFLKNMALNRIKAQRQMMLDDENGDCFVTNDHMLHVVLEWHIIYNFTFLSLMNNSTRVHI